MKVMSSFNLEMRKLSRYDLLVIYEIFNIHSSENAVASIGPITVAIDIRP